MSVVCEWFGLKTTRTVSSSLVSKPAATVFTGLASKPVVTVSPGLTSKPAVSFLVWASKPIRLRFVGCATKSTEGDQRGTHVEI
jgi:hypothetical protein